MKRRQSLLVPLATSLLLAGCQAEAPPEADATDGAEAVSPIEAKVDQYTTFRLTSDLEGLTDNQRQILPLLIDAARSMDAAFWQQAYGGKDQLLSSIDDPSTRHYAEINYGPWDRLDGNASFIDGVGAKPAGANFYPNDMTLEELEAAAADQPELTSQYSMVTRDEAGELVATPYSEAFAELYGQAADKLEQAAVLAEDDGFRRYLELRAEALRSDDYLASDMAWMEMKSNAIDVVIGPIESYEDQLAGTKTSSEAYVLIKDTEWSSRLSKYAAMLPDLQGGLPVDDAYKRESPGIDSDLNAYDVIYYAGDCNAGSKTIAINLPNDERVQLEKGTRRLQLKNAMRAKFDKIMLPIAGELIAQDQRSHVTFDAFFGNTMFHEVAHGLGIKKTIDGSGTVREALGAHASALEEGKADVLGLYMVSKLHEQGELGDADLMDNYVTFLAGIFRSVRFGSSSAHGVANMIRFNFFAEQGAFSRNDDTGTYRVDAEKMAQAVDALSERILVFQGNGDMDAVATFVEQFGSETAQLRADLERLAKAGIPVDVVFEQGPAVLGLN